MDYPDAENIYQLFYGPNQSLAAESNYDNPELNKLYEQMAVLETGPKHAQLIQETDQSFRKTALGVRVL